MAEAPPHVWKVYQQGSGKNIVQLFVMAHLLQLFAFPEHQSLVRPVLRSPPTRPFAARSLLANTTGFQVLLTHHGQNSSSALSTWNMSAKPCATNPRSSDHEATLRAEVEGKAKKDRFAGPFSASYFSLPGCLRTRAPWVFEPPGPSQSNSKARFAEVTTGFAQATKPQCSQAMYEGTQTIIAQLRQAAAHG